MLTLQVNDLDLPAWKQTEIVLPCYDIRAVRHKTCVQPQWVHFGCGNIFRSLIARISNTLLCEGLTDTGIIAVEAYDAEIINRIYRPNDNLSLLALIDADGTIQKSLLASVAQSLHADQGYPDDRRRLEAVFQESSLQMASFTITEKGYTLHDMAGDLTSAAKTDLAARPADAKLLVGIAAYMLYVRYRAGRLPIAMVSMDNCTQNGDLLKAGILTYASAWRESGFAEPGFINYVLDAGAVSFPLTMIDKITPGPSKHIEDVFRADGIDGVSPLITGKGTHAAPFANAEISEYLVLEDSFPNGRPDFKAAGVFLCDRETVKKTETMKVTACLNPLHTALSIFGWLLGYETVSSAMSDPLLAMFLERLGYEECLPVVEHPGILSPKDFLDDVLNRRFRNPYIPHTTKEILTGTSLKLPIRFGVTLNKWGLLGRAEQLMLIPLTLAGWLRYLLAVDDCGIVYALSADPNQEQLTAQFEGIQFGKPESYQGNLKATLRNQTLFGADLESIGITQKIEAIFQEMIVAPGAVRAVLERYVSLQTIK
jgi:fructuronate reductase